jgi:hypothetical protein
LYYLGTKNGTEPYQNPHLIGTVKITTCFDHRKSAFLIAEHSLNPLLEEHSFHGVNYVTLDLGEGRTLLPTRYCVREKEGQPTHPPPYWAQAQVGRKIDIHIYRLLYCVFLVV